MRSHSAGRPDTGGPPLHVPTSVPARALRKSKPGSAPGPSTESRRSSGKRITVEPAAEHDAHVQLRIGTETIVAAKVEEAARVVRRSQRHGSRWAPDIGAADVIVPRPCSNVGVQVPSRPRIVGIGARVESAARPSRRGKALRRRADCRATVDRR